MYKFIKSGLFIVLSIMLFSTVGCQKDNIGNLENQTLTFEEFFDKVSSMNIQTSEKNVIVINYTLDKKNNLITITDSQEQEASWGVALEVASLRDNSNFQERSLSDKYQVSCSTGDKSWNKKCDGKWSCGRAIYKCLNEGGCAEICALKMEYYAPEKIFFLESKEDD